jgi:cell division protease FtsH
MALDPSSRKQTVAIGYFVAAGIAMLLLQWVLAAYNTVDTIPFSEFEQLVAQGGVTEVAVGQDTIQGKLKDKLPSGKSAFVTARVDSALAEKLEAKGVVVTGVPSGGLFQTILSWVAPALMFYLIWIFLGRRLTDRQGFGGMMSIGKSRAKVYVEKDTKVTFADVAGVEEAKFELQEVVSFLKDPKSYGRLGAHVPKGILLVGPPGTGKTLLARAVAGEAGVAFFSISGSEFVEMFVGVGAARVRDLFEQARKAAPCIIFIDELDALGPQPLARCFRRLRREGADPEPAARRARRLRSQRRRHSAGGHQPARNPRSGAAAGRAVRSAGAGGPSRQERSCRHPQGACPQDQDRQGCRSGQGGGPYHRFHRRRSRQPDQRGGDRGDQARGGRGMLSTISRSRSSGSWPASKRRAGCFSKDERRRVAYHEMGHALVAASLPGVDPVQKVSIIPRGVGALGYTMQRPTEDRFLLTASELKNRIAVLMGGRASEQLIFDGDISTGAADDLQRATEIAIEMVTKYGMDAKVGQRTYAPRPQTFLPAMQDAIVSAAEATGREIDLAVRELIEAGGACARGILEKRRDDLDAGVELLIAHETVTAEQFAPLRPAGTGQVAA